ncbi:MAG: heat-inducible transcription repressor HrcA [Anaerolineales bacterium]|nr:heat-inducible transcription repressor HrcA [Anaerolineales bacterium]MCB0029975.1 heat-inducible transcription repressor HrcA [Anaerolineales bacterium]MCB8962604.1 heat-inducible transcription repressor HrcA [Ardenticatenales bacterium]
MDSFKPLSERQQYILGLLVRSYIESGSPVGSKTLVGNYDLDLSSATVRNELAQLDQLGYLQQLHTSAGRVPTELGFRYFVQRLLGEFQLPTDERQKISHQFHQASTELEQWLRLSAAVLAHTTQGASFITAPRPRLNRYKHVQVISTQGRLVLMILVLYGGQIKQQMLTLAEPLAQIRLSAAADRLNLLFEGRNMDEIVARLSQLDDLENELARLISDLMRMADAKQISEIYRAGLSNLLEDEGTRQAVRVLEERPKLANILSELGETEFSSVQVVIGGEGRWEELRDCSIILSRYGVSDELVGELAVVGSMRMPYGRNISAVRYVADLMSGFVNDYYAEDRLEADDSAEDGDFISG